MREADNKSWSIFLSVVGVYVVRTSSLNDKHSCQLFRKASSLVLLSSSVSTANLSCLLATTFSSLRSTSPHFNLLRVARCCFSYSSVSGDLFFPLVLLLALSFSCLSSAFLSSVLQSLLLALSFSFLSERFFFSFFFIHAKALAYRKWITRVSLV